MNIRWPDTWWPWPDKQSVYQHIRELWGAHSDLHQVFLEALNEMREYMANTDELVGRFGAATDEIARDLQALRDEVAGLDANVAAKFEPLVSRLEGLGADPENPIPPVEPAPEQ